MRKVVLCFLPIFLFSSSHILRAGGISVDAGLTPAQDRFILRTQYRYMSMGNPMMSTKTHMIPLVVAYGITSGFSLMARGMFVTQSFSNDAESKTGFNDLYLLSKYRLYRKNTANYVFGIAPHIASNIPIGNTSISMRTWNPEVGLNISFRPRFFAFDISTAYTFTDVLKKSTIEQSNAYSLNTAFSAIIPMRNNSSKVISPVAELSYINKSNSKQVENDEIIFVSPGVSYIYSSLVFEGLIQVPVYQSLSGDNIMSQRSRLIIGIKFML